MKIERDERKFDFHGIGLAIKKAREREGMTQEQLGYIVDRDPRTIMYHENDGQHPSLNAFYQMLDREAGRLHEQEESVKIGGAFGKSFIDGKP